MEKLLIIGFNSTERINKGYAYWSGNYLNEISYYSRLDELNSEKTSLGLAYLTGRENFEAKCINLHIDNITLKDNNLGIKYTPLDESPFTSSKVKSTLLEVLNDKFGIVMNLPFCAAIDSKDFSYAIDDIDMIMQIKKLKSKNKWNEILNLFGEDKDIKRNTLLWNNKMLLDNIAFAAAKLSECYENVKRNYPDKAEADKFLNKKRHYRNLTLNLRKRCIELSPQQAGLYSNLAYSHYQFARELSQPGGRRDDNLLEEIKLALENMDKALSLDPNRITDLYRKGKLICDILLSRFQFTSNGKSPNEIKIKTFDKSYSNYRECLIKGKESFKKVIDIYHTLPLIDEKSLERYFKEYIKSLYSLGTLNLKFIRYKFSYLSLLGVRQNYYNFENDKILLIEASKYIKECCFKDNTEIKKYHSSPDLMLASKYNGAVDGVYKLYSIGKIYSIMYQIYHTVGKDNEAEEYFIYAEKYFSEALRFPFPKEKIMQNKNFIKEKTARNYIMHNEPEKAIKILESIKGNIIDYYIRYSLAAAYYKMEMKDKAIEQVKKSLENPKFNKDVATGEKMLEIFNDKSG